MKFININDLKTVEDFEEAINYATDRAEELVAKAKDLSKEAEEWYSTTDDLWDAYYEKFPPKKIHLVSQDQIELNPDFFNKD